MNKKPKPFKKLKLVAEPMMPEFSDYVEETKNLWQTPWITNNGPKVQKLEESLKKILKVSNVSIFVNGTIALMTAIKSLNLKGEVITTPFTFAATAHALSWNQITPIFCDVDYETMNIDVSKIEKLITPKTSAILATHIFGTPCDVLGIERIAKKHNLKVIYDGANTFEVEIGSKGIGEFGDITMFSFHAMKLYNTVEGGGLAFGDNNLKEKINRLRNFGIESEDDVVEIGINGKMTEFHAAFGLVNLKQRKGERKKRKELKKIYEKRLSKVNGVKLLPKIPKLKESYEYFPIKINKKEFGKSRDYVRKKLLEFNVQTKKWFFPLCSNYKCYKKLPSADKNKLPNANRVAEEILCLPFYGKLQGEEVNKICDMLEYIKYN